MNENNCSQNKIFRIGIIGAGSIARKLAATIARMDAYQTYAVASRSLDKARAFAIEHNIPKAYGSYEELVKDSLVDLVYIATPHSHHFEHAMLAIKHRKATLVEKAFTANAGLAGELLATAEKEKVFITEAIWTRYMPMSAKIKEIMNSGAIGTPRLLTASLCYSIEHKERIVRPELCGGALLDLGVYVLNFARMYFGDDYIKSVSNCQLSSEGVDLQEAISLSYPGGRMANLQAGTLCQNDRQGIISGSEGYIRVDNVNCPELIEVYRKNELVESIKRPDDMITGYEYEIRECRRCVEEGLLQSPFMPHEETLAVMRQMDGLRAEWGVKFPQD